MGEFPGFDERERSFLAAARRGFLATADEAGRPAAIPVCFALLGEAVVTPVDEKPQRVRPHDLRRIRDIEANPRVTLAVDHYEEDWTRLGWVQVRGRASVVESDTTGHRAGVDALREKYAQYDSHALHERPLIRITPGHVVSWGSLSEAH